jgi:predicted nucleic acid-binding protein
MIVTDASVWVSHLVAGDAHHASSRRWLTRIVREGIVIAAPGLLLAEVAGAVARRTNDPGLGHWALEHVLSTPDLRLVHSDPTLSMAAARLAADRRVRGADALYIAVAQQLNIPLISWDREQIDRASKIVQSFSPE